MPVYRLGNDLVFPDPQEADPSGLLAVGGDLRPERLLLAYARGIFPWYEETQPILWHSPDPRLVLRPPDLRVGRSLRRAERAGPYSLTLDTAFERVIRGCATVPRPEGDGTWITRDMIDAYLRLFELGYAHSTEAWCGDTLAGGLYGVSLGGCFFGESMFAREPDASKLALVALVRQLASWEFDLIDCQVHSEHLSRFGAVDWARARFLARLEESLQKTTRRGRWRFDAQPDSALAEA